MNVGVQISLETMILFLLDIYLERGLLDYTVKIPGILFGIGNTEVKDADPDIDYKRMRGNEPVFRPQVFTESLVGTELGA